MHFLIAVGAWFSKVNRSISKSECSCRYIQTDLKVCKKMLLKAQVHDDKGRIVQNLTRYVRGITLDRVFYKHCRFWLSLAKLNVLAKCLAYD